VKAFAYRAASFVLAAVLCLGLAPIALAASAYERPNQKLVALTFDDGPGTYSDQILDTLEAHGAKATFFLNGYKISEFADQVRRMAAEGHQVANHTWDHPQLSKKSDAEVRRQISSVAAALTEVTGLKGTGATGFYLRPPYGDYSSRVANAAGVPLVMWSVDTEDWKYQDSARLTSYTVSVVQDGDIVLMHETHKSTARGLDNLLTALEGKDFEMVTVDELLWRRGVEAQAGKVYTRVRNTGVNRCPRSEWYDESKLYTHWAFSSIRYALDAGLMSCNEAGEFLPNFSMTRGEAAVALGRLYGAAVVIPAADPFADVPRDSAAAPYIAWAHAAGVMNGVSAKYFAPDKPITRQEFAVVAARFARLYGVTVPVGSASAPYADRAQIAGWAIADVGFCSVLGVFRGNEKSEFLPGQEVTRGAGAAVLDRLHTLAEKHRTH